MFGWLPLIGPVIDGIVSVIKGHQDVKLQMYKQDGTVDIEAMKAFSELQSINKDDISLRIMRDAALFFPILWSAFVGWDTIVAKHYPELMFHVADYPTNVGYIPYAAFTFLFGNIGFVYWKRNR